MYKTVAAGEIVFSSKDKFVSETGWPAFTKPAEVMNGKTSCIVEVPDNKFYMKRTEIACNKDGVHLGHLFKDGPKQFGGLRYCINSAAMLFVPKEELSDQER